jgi:hypothetical protein
MAPPSLSISSYSIIGVGADLIGIVIEEDDIEGDDLIGIDIAGEEALMGRKICGSIIGAGDGAYSPRWNGSDAMNSSSSSCSSSVNFSKRTAGAGDARMLPPNALRRVNRMSNTMKTYSRSILYALLLR